MKSHVWAATLVLAISAACIAVGGIAAGQDDPVEKPKDEAVKFINSEENSIAREIWGSWTMDDDLTKRTAHEVPKDVGTFEFKKDAEAEARIKQAMEVTLEKIGEGEKVDFVRQAASGIYCAGRLIIKRGDQTHEVDFAQVSMWGEPVIMVLEEEDGETDWESVRVSFVRDPEGDNDLLFVGGDHKNEPYVAYKRLAE